MAMPRETERQRAIRYVKEERASHVHWAIWLADKRKTHPEMARAYAPTVGGLSYHRRWIRRYDLVLKVLGRECP
jgi:hypothetical protein